MISGIGQDLPDNTPVSDNSFDVFQSLDSDPDR